MNDHHSFTDCVDSLMDHLRQMSSDGVVSIPLSEEGRMALAALSAPATKSVYKNSPPAATSPGPAARAPVSLRTPPVPPRPASDNIPFIGTQSVAGTVLESSVNPLPPQSARSNMPSASPKAAALAALRPQVLACQKCPNLAASRKSVVFGVGNPDSPLLFVGEAPGADEDEQGEPFVGKAGQLLTKIIQAMGLERKDVYIANILKCRPDTPGQTAGNRKPTADEMQTCIPHLLSQIDIIQPKVIVALGATAVEGLLGKTVGITRLRGNWQTFHQTPVMPTYHPAYLLRNQSLSEKRKVWEDMLQVMARLEMPISEKQRGYFQAS